MNLTAVHPERNWSDEVALKPRFIFHCLALLVVIAAVAFA